jgi:YHS domain-containing protein
VIFGSSASSRRALACQPESDGFQSKAGENTKRETMNNRSTIAIFTALLIGSSIAMADSGIPKDYPLKKCPVSGDGFDHGKPVKATAPDGTDVYLCCKDCLKDFKKDPSKYAKMVKDAQKKKK